MKEEPKSSRPERVKEEQKSSSVKQEDSRRTKNGREVQQTPPKPVVGNGKKIEIVRSKDDKLSEIIIKDTNP